MITFIVKTLDLWGHGAHECGKVDDCPCMKEGEHDDNRCDCSYTVNDMFRAGTFTVVDDASDEDIWLALVDQGFAKGEFAKASFEDPSCMGEFIEVSERETGKPVFYLEKA